MGLSVLIVEKNSRHGGKLEQLEWQIEQDIPTPENISHTRIPFKHWLKLCHDFYNNS